MEVAIRGKLDLGRSLIYSGFSLYVSIIYDALNVLRRTPMTSLDTGWSHPSPVHSYPLSNGCEARHGQDMMTSSNGNIFRVTGHLCGEFTGPRWIPHTKASDAELWCFFDLRPNKRLSKQPWCWWFATPSWSLWRQCNVRSSLMMCLLWDLGLSLKYSGFSLYVSIICHAPNCSTTDTHDITGYGVKSPQSCTFLSQWSWGQAWSRYAKLRIGLYKLWSLSLPIVLWRLVGVSQKLGHI